MNKRANLYFAALLGAMSPLCTVSALAAQSNSTIATATQQQNSCTGTVKDATGEPIIGATIRIEGKSKRLRIYTIVVFSFVRTFAP